MVVDNKPFIRVLIEQEIEKFYGIDEKNNIENRTLLKLKFNKVMEKLLKEEFINNYLIKCDSENNFSYAVERNIIIIDTYIEEYAGSDIKLINYGVSEFYEG